MWQQHVSEPDFLGREKVPPKLIDALGTRARTFRRGRDKSKARLELILWVTSVKSLNHAPSPIGLNRMAESPEEQRPAGRPDKARYETCF